MATDNSSDTFSGLMIPDPRIITANLDASDSTYTQAGPFPGAVVSQDTPRSDMTFRPSGTQSADKQLRLRCGRGGYPAVDASGGGVLWKYEADASTTWRGWDTYNVITGFEWLVQVPNVNTAEYSSPHAVTLETGKVLLAYRSTLTGSNDVITIRSVVPGGAWTHEATVTPSVQHSDLYPNLQILPDGSVLLMYWVVDTGSATAQLEVQRSTDGGATWTVASSGALISEVSTATYPTLGRMRSAYSTGQILACAHVNDGGADRLAQWASDDNGASFTEVEIWGATTGSHPSILAKKGGGFHVIVTDPGGKARDIGSAYQPLSSITATSINVNPDSVFADQDGTWYGFGVGGISGVEWDAYRSVDDGANWVRVSDDGDYSGFWTQQAAASMAPKVGETTATYMEGRCVFVCKFVSGGTSSIDTDSVGVVYVGGSSTHTMPSSSRFSRDTLQTTFGRTWLPFEDPGYATDIARQVTGAPTESFVTGGYRVQTSTGASSLYWEDTAGLHGVAADVTGEVVVHAAVIVAAGGSVSTDDIAIRVINADAGDDFSVDIRFSTTQFRVRDNRAGTGIGTVSVDMTVGVEFRIGLRSPTGSGINDGAVAVWYRLMGTQSDNERQWTAGPTSATLRSGGAVVNAEVKFGAFNQTTTDATWVWFQYRKMAPGVAGWSAGQINPDDVFPRPISRYAIGLDDGVKVEAIDGPAYEGQTWNVDTRYQYGVECMDPTIHPSPQRKHRTTDETQHEYAWDLHGLTANSRLGVQTVALYLEGINWRSGELFGRTNGGFYVSLGTIDSAVNRNGLRYSLVGDVVTVNTATTTDAAEYIHYNDFAGGTFFLADGKPRKIIRHTEGSWTDQLTRRPEFFLEGIDGTEATTGTVGAIWSPRLLVVVHNLQEYRHLKLRVDAQTTADGYLETGIATIGPVHIFGQGYSWGRRVTVTPNGSLTTRRDGSRVARRNGEARMAVDLAWRDGVNEWTLYPTAGGNPVPNYMTGTSTGGTQPIATPYDTAHKVQGIAHELAEDMPCVYIPRIDRGTPDLVQYASRWDMLYGRIRGPVGLENIIGDSRAGEIWRIANVRIEQEQ